MLVLHHEAFIRHHQSHPPNMLHLILQHMGLSEEKSATIPFDFHVMHAHTLPNMSLLFLKSTSLVDLCQMSLYVAYQLFE